MTQKKLALLFLSAIIILTGCAGLYEVKAPTGEIIHQTDNSVRIDEDPDLNLVVTGFKWRYSERTRNLKIWGWAENRGRKAARSIRILVRVFDQFDKELGSADAFLMPSYIQPGKKGEFSFYIPEGFWVKNLHLKYSFESRI